MSFKDIFAGLVEPLTQGVKGWQENKRIKKEAQAYVDKKQADLASSDAEFAGKLALINAENQNNTWKDEYALITITAPYWVAMLIALATTIGPFDYDASEVIKAMFEPMSEIPEYWQTTFQYAIWSALGITAVKKVFKA